MEKMQRIEDMFKRTDKGIKVVKASLEVIDEYPNISKWTLRQIYYRLVSKQIFENTKNNYQALSRYLVKARKKNIFPYSKMEDRGREIVSNIQVLKHNSIETQISNKLSSIGIPPTIDFDKNIGQNKITVIVLEKKALEGIFKTIMSNMCVLIVCKGFNSLTQLKEVVNLLKNDNREKNCYIFSDYDPSGKSIQKNFRTQCNELGLEFNKFERKALTPELIEKYDLPGTPAKGSDPRSKTWNGDDVVELDALEPPVLKQLLNECIKENWDEDIYHEVKKRNREYNSKIKEKYPQEFKKIIKKIIKRG